MTPETFVFQVQSIVVKQKTIVYKDLLESTTVESASDPYWKRLLTLYSSLSEADRQVIFEIMRQVSVDTISELFGILDGVCALEGSREDFELISRPDNQKLNGNLQDLFLEAVENDRQDVENMDRHL